MFKYKRILDNLGVGQKVRLLSRASALSDIEFKALGIPEIKLGDFAQYCEKSFVAPNNLANSFDRELYYKVARATFIEMSRDGVNCAIVKGPKIKINPFDNSYSEDVFATVAIVGEILRAAADSSMAVCLSDFNITNYDADWMDITPNVRIIRDYIIKPFETALASGGCLGVFVDNVSEDSPYYKVNEEMKRYAMSGGLSGFGGFLLSRHTSAHNTVKAIVSGEICLDASENILKAAYDKYESMKDGIAKGKVTVGELISAEEAGDAISMESIDSALDRLIEFAYECNKTSVSLLNTDGDAHTLRERCYRESTVLLKNANGTLPIEKEEKIALIGDIINYPDGVNFTPTYDTYVDYLSGLGYTVSGYAQGYEVSDVLSTSDVSHACELARNSDKVIVFLGKTRLGEKYITKTENLYLDANQGALIEGLMNYRHKVIFVLSGGYMLDANFSKQAAAVILTPDSRGDGVMQALRVILGQENAEGKLSKPMYFDTQSFEKGRIYRKHYGNLVGPFMGYRYTDTAGLDNAYPIGHGFYSPKIKYSNLVITDSEVTFTVKNASKKLSATDVVQVYLGLDSTSLALPKRELVGFLKIDLEPKEVREVKIPYEFSLYDKEKGRNIAPVGDYRIYVGSSIDKIYLSGEIHKGEEELSVGVREKLSDYLQSESNILSDKYTLEADYKLMKKSFRNIIFGCGAVAIAIVLALFSMVAGINSAFLYVISAIMICAGIAFFVLHGVDATKLEKAERAKIDEANKKHFEDAEKISVFSAEQMFINEFDRHEPKVADDDVAIDYMEDEYFKYVKKDFKFKDLVSDFGAFARSKGYKIEESVICEIFSAISASRLLITKMSEEAYAELVALLCEYFECPVCLDRVDPTYTTEESLLYKQTESGKVKTNAMRAIEYAQKSLQNIFVLALTNVMPNDISTYFVPYAKYVRNPLSNIVVTYQNENGADKRIAITKNVWFMMNLSPEATAYDMPAYISEVASLQSISFTRCAPSESGAELNKLKFYQLDYMIDKSRSKSFILEDTWKKIDKLESIVAQDGRRMTNKLTVGFEKYVNVFALCGGDATDGFYRAMGVKLLPYFAAENCEPKAISSMLDALEAVFGEENAQKCQRSLKENSKNSLN